MAEEQQDYYQEGYFRLLDAIVWFLRRYHLDASHYVDELRTAGVITSEESDALHQHLSRIIRGYPRVP